MAQLQDKGQIYVTALRAVAATAAVEVRLRSDATRLERTAENGRQRALQRDRQRAVLQEREIGFNAELVGFLLDLELGFSRDGFHWHRPDRDSFIGVSEQKGSWNWANIQSAGGGCVINTGAVARWLELTSDPARAADGHEPVRVRPRGEGAADLPRCRGSGVRRADLHRPRPARPRQPDRLHRRYLHVHAEYVAQLRGT